MPHTEEQLVSLLYDVRERIPDGVYVTACAACKCLHERRQAIHLMTNTMPTTHRTARSWRREYERELDFCARRIMCSLKSAYVR